MTEPDAVIPDIDSNEFRNAYYRTADKTIGGQLALGRCAFSIADRLAPQYEIVPPDTLEKIVLESLLAAPRPDEKYDPLKRPALDIMATAIRHDMPVYIWTVGDTGAYKDPENGIDDPAYNYQEVKILESKIAERLAEMTSSDKPVELHVNTSAISKKKALHDIFLEAVENGIEEVFIADDLYQNELIVNEMASKFPELKVTFWLVKGDEDTAGNIAACRDCMIPELDQNAVEGRKTIVVLDLDDTIFSTQKSLSRAAELTQTALRVLLKPTEQPTTLPM